MPNNAPEKYRVTVTLERDSGHKLHTIEALEGGNYAEALNMLARIEESVLNIWKEKLDL